MLNWRALAVTGEGKEHHLVMGGSHREVKEEYAEAFNEVLQDEERKSVSRIELQQWRGLPDQGRWEFKGVLPLPKSSGVKSPASRPVARVT